MSSGIITRLEEVDTSTKWQWKTKESEENIRMEIKQKSNGKTTKTGSKYRIVMKNSIENKQIFKNYSMDTEFVLSRGKVSENMVEFNIICVQVLKLIKVSVLVGCNNVDEENWGTIMSAIKRKVDSMAREDDEVKKDLESVILEKKRGFDDFIDEKMRRKKENDGGSDEAVEEIERKDEMVKRGKMFVERDSDDEELFNEQEKQDKMKGIKFSNVDEVKDFVEKFNRAFSKVKQVVESLQGKNVVFEIVMSWRDVAKFQKKVGLLKKANKTLLEFFRYGKNGMLEETDSDEKSLLEKLNRFFLDLSEAFKKLQNVNEFNMIMASSAAEPSHHELKILESNAKYKKSNKSSSVDIGNENAENTSGIQVQDQMVKKVIKKSSLRTMDALLEVEKETKRDLKKIDAKMNEVVEIFKDMKEATDLQGEQIDSMEENIQRSHNFIYKGVKSVHDAKKTRSNFF